MDSSSIITQVTREEDLLQENFPPERAKSILRKTRSKGLLNSLLCCFGGPRNYRNSSIHSEENGHHSITPDTCSEYLLPPVKPKDFRKMCMVIDLDETLVHSSFKPIRNADFIVPVEIDGAIHPVYVLKRPYVDDFLKKMGELYECVLFTASLAKYADPVADILDKWEVFRCRLFREHCVFYRGNYVKDLGRLGRDLRKVIIIDNSPASYIFHPDNAVPVNSWFDDVSDTELKDLIPFLEQLTHMEDAHSILRQHMANSLPSPTLPR